VQSTLMRAIANGQVDGFPSKDELRTVYVEHDIDGESGEMSVVNYVLADPTLKGEIDEAQAKEALSSVGFTDTMQQNAVSTLSGGWKMKLALGESSLTTILFGSAPINSLGSATS
jgi:elongation factor 3